MGVPYKSKVALKTWRVRICIDVASGSASVRAEIDDGGAATVGDPQFADAMTPSDRVSAVINCLSAAFDLADNPQLLGAELVNVLKMSGNSSQARIVETPETSIEGFD